jgi:sugar lactone lactonase YvrE
LNPKRGRTSRLRGRACTSCAPWRLLQAVGVLLAAGPAAAQIQLVESDRLDLAYPAYVEPWAVACGPLGQLYLSDLGRGTVLRLDARGRILFEFGSPSTQPGLQPLDIEVTGFQVYVLDAVANALLRFSDRGSYLDVLQSFQSRGIETPRAVAVDASGRVLLANPAWHAVRLIGETQQTETLVGGFGARAGDLTAPAGVAFAPDGSFYVSDSRGAHIQRFSGVGNYEATLTEGLREPRGLAVGTRGELYAADARGSVHVFSADGTAHAALALDGLSPVDVAVNADTLWVLSRDPKALVRVRVVRGE